VIPADTTTAEPPQLGGEQTARPAWWPADSIAADSVTADSAPGDPAAADSSAK
jgi:hypothetical protein